MKILTKGHFFPAIGWRNHLDVVPTGRIGYRFIYSSAAGAWVVDLHSLFPWPVIMTDFISSTRRVAHIVQLDLDRSKGPPRLGCIWLLSSLASRVKVFHSFLGLELNKYFRLRSLSLLLRLLRIQMWLQWSQIIGHYYANVDNCCDEAAIFWKYFWTEFRRKMVRWLNETPAVLTFGWTTIVVQMENSPPSRAPARRAFLWSFKHFFKTDNTVSRIPRWFSRQF